MFEILFQPIVLFVIAAVLVIGVFVGVGLGRRSSKANKFYDEARARWAEREAQMQAQIQRLQDKVKK